jgi:hypothetical protein
MECVGARLKLRGTGAGAGAGALVLAGLDDHDDHLACIEYLS